MRKKTVGYGIVNSKCSKLRSLKKMCSDALPLTLGVILIGFTVAQQCDSHARL